MSVLPEVLHVVRQWVEKAEEDLLTSEHALTLRDHCPVGTICFHAQQCVEKYLKGLLAFHSVPFPKSHDLLEILTLVPESAGLRLQPTEIGCRLGPEGEDRGVCPEGGLRPRLRPAGRGLLSNLVQGADLCR